MNFSPPLNDLPAEVAALTAGARWQQIQIGLSGTEVYRLSFDSEALYLKIAAGYQAVELKAETERIQWMQGRLPVPRVLYAGVDDAARRYLLLTEVPGFITIDPDLPLSPEQITRALAKGMHIFHQLDISDCPFDHSLARRLPLVGQKLKQGIVDEAPEVLQPIFRNLQNNPPSNEGRVFTHGDYCLPNILLDPQTAAITGFIDLARAGICDPHQDIALCIRSLIYNFGEEWVPLLIETYGKDQIDPEKVIYYQQLDRFFW